VEAGELGSMEGRGQERLKQFELVICVIPHIKCRYRCNRASFTNVPHSHIYGDRKNFDFRIRTSKRVAFVFGLEVMPNPRDGILQDLGHARSQ